ncbi:MAG TPA: cardiolipin synthase [Bacteroidales bacterium]|mgnify:CR=1 FL=1|nr:cardiolipin synthase [Bacteroidales bacterium]
MNWLTLLEIAYTIILVLACYRIIYDTHSSSKTLAYLLLAVFVPVAGILFYFIFGVNYRKEFIFSKKLIADEKRLRELNEQIVSPAEKNFRLNTDAPGDEDALVKLLLHDNQSPLTNGNSVKLLINGEEKFPEIIKALDAARNHIHMEYFIYEDDKIGNIIKEILIKKAGEGVMVRLIYDDYGSRSIRKELVNELRSGGVEAYPFNSISLPFFANRVNYRNHRKIIIIDGQTGFTGGINISDRYINEDRNNNKLFWRDTHLRIDGPGVFILQHIFLCDWNFCSKQKIEAEKIYFNPVPSSGHNVRVQIAASGPDSPNSTIKLSLLKAFTMSKKEILVTTPYFIPSGSIMDVLKIAALGGVSVKMLLPGISDSKMVNTAAHSYYGELMRAGVEIYLYHKGFIHAKTVVIDNLFAIIGTANLNHRSFNFDFEVNAHIYNADFSEKVREVFYADIRDAKRLCYETWKTRPVYVKAAERVARLFSPVF